MIVVTMVTEKEENLNYWQILGRSLVTMATRSPRQMILKLHLIEL